MKVLICGAGGGKLTCAYWLHQAGHTTVVVERDQPGPGNGIGFSGTGYDVAGRMGILDRLAARPLRSDSIAYVDAAKRVTAQLDLYRTQPHGGIPRPERRGVLRATYAGVGWHTPELLVQAPGDGFLMDTLTQIEMPVWHRGRVVLIGDAYGASTLTSAQGAALAMAGGYLLAEAIAAQPGDLTAVFAAYEARLRPVVTERQRRARAFTRRLVPATRTTPTTHGVQRLLTRLILRDAWLPVLRAGFGDTSSILRTPPSDAKPIDTEEMKS